MHFSIHIDTISMGLPTVNFKGSPKKFSSVMNVLLLMVRLHLAKDADPDEFQHYVEFHLDVHCLPKYHFQGFQ